jgi:hypothetical protein
MLLRSVILSILLCLTALAAGAQEPTYTVTLPEANPFRVRLNITVQEGGGRSLRVTPILRYGAQPGPDPQKERVLGGELLLDAENVPLFCRALTQAPGWGGEPYEVRRDTQATALTYLTRVGAQTGKVGYSGKLIVPIGGVLFMGRLYDFKKGGPQSFSVFPGFGSASPRIGSLLLTAEGNATVAFPTGAVKARKLKYSLSPIMPGDKRREGFVYIGPSGEVLQSEPGIFWNHGGMLPKVSGPAVYEKGPPPRLRLPGAWQNSYLMLQAERTRDGYTVGFAETQQKKPFAQLLLDKNYNPVKWDNQMGWGFSAEVLRPGEIRWETNAGREEKVPITEGQAWFFPQWFVTEGWEAGSGTLSAVKPGESKTGMLFMLHRNTQERYPVNIERLADRDIVTPKEQKQSLHHWRFTSRERVYDVFTDGKRLVALRSNEGMEIMRDGWETAAKELLPSTARTGP